VVVAEVDNNGDLEIVTGSRGSEDHELIGGENDGTANRSSPLRSDR
jgi:hypothetical protein